MEPKNKQQLKLMSQGGEILSQVMQEVVANVQKSISLKKLDEIAAHKIKELKAESSFMRVPNYYWATCLCVNDTVVHGIPSDYSLQEGDLIGIDAGVYYQNFHTDMSWTVGVGEMTREKQRFMLAGQKALLKALEMARAGNRVGHISQAIEQAIEKEAGYSVAKQLVGHGVGKELHEDPFIPGILTKPIEKTPLLLENQTLAIEIIYAQGKGDICYKNDDGWTIATADGSLAGLYEVTVAVAQKGPQVLTPFARLLNKEVYNII